MNWGKGIAIALTLFIVFIATLVTIITRQKVDLVSDDYYSQEINYQQEIDGINAGNNEQELSFLKKNEQLVVEIPEKTNTRNVTFLFYRANDKSLDKIFQLENSKMLLIPLTELAKGNYSVRAEYEIDGKIIIQLYEVTI